MNYVKRQVSDGVWKHQLLGKSCIKRSPIYCWSFKFLLSKWQEITSKIALLESNGSDWSPPSKQIAVTRRNHNLLFIWVQLDGKSLTLRQAALKLVLVKSLATFCRTMIAIPISWSSTPAPVPDQTDPRDMLFHSVLYYFSAVLTYIPHVNLVSQFLNTFFLGIRGTGFQQSRCLSCHPTKILKPSQRKKRKSSSGLLIHCKTPVGMGTVLTDMFTCDRHTERQTNKVCNE